MNSIAALYSVRKIWLLNLLPATWTIKHNEYEMSNRINTESECLKCEYCHRSKFSRCFFSSLRCVCVSICVFAPQKLLELTWRKATAVTFCYLHDVFMHLFIFGNNIFAFTRSLERRSIVNGHNDIKWRQRRRCHCCWQGMKFRRSQILRIGCIHLSTFMRFSSKWLLSQGKQNIEIRLQLDNIRLKRINLKHRDICIVFISTIKYQFHYLNHFHRDTINTVRAKMLDQMWFASQATAWEII